MFTAVNIAAPLALAADKKPKTPVSKKKAPTQASKKVVKKDSAKRTSTKSKAKTKSIGSKTPKTEALAPAESGNKLEIVTNEAGQKSCEIIFNGKKITIVESKPVPDINDVLEAMLAKDRETYEVMVDRSPVPLTYGENTNIVKGKRGWGTALIDKNHYSDLYYDKRATGKFAQVTLVADGIIPTDHLLSGNKSNSGNGVTRYQSNQVSTNFGYKSNNVQPVNVLAIYNTMQARKDLLDRYFRVSMQKMADFAYDMMISNLWNDENTLRSAYEYFENIRQVELSRTQRVEGLGVKLSNTGPYRHFWYIPSGKSSYVPARVLDITKYDASLHNLHGIVITVEYFDMGATDTGPFERIRHIDELSIEDLKTIKIHDRDQVEELFEESLTSQELETKLFAIEHKMKLFGFIEFGLDGETPLEMMNNITWIAIRESIEHKFGSIRDLYRDGETFEQTNVIDLFARLKPDYVLWRFFDMGFDYMWVITEDGKLKVSPKMDQGNNLKAQLLRLAGGRRIYGGGGFKFDRFGNVSINLETNNYQLFDIAWSIPNTNAFQHENPSLENFVKMVWETQTRHKVNNLSFYTTESYFRMTEHGADAGGPTNARDFHEKFMGRAGKREKSPSGPSLVWDPNKDESPLDYPSWLLKTTGSSSDPRRRDIKLNWARYVLLASPTEYLTDTKHRYHSLSKKYHPLYNPNGEETMKVLSEAWAVIQGRDERRNN